MKKALIAVVAFLGCYAAAAQEYFYADPDSDFRCRATAALDYRISSGFHLNVGEELRMRDSFGAFDRSYSSAGLSYKVCNWLKLGADYTFMYINRNLTELEVDLGEEPEDFRHRAGFNVFGMYKVGPWRFSLKERLQLTHKTRDVNPFQSPRNELVLRSRFKAGYAFYDKPFKPYAAFEVRNPLNAVDPESLGLSKSTAGTVSYSDIYVDRLRYSVGVEWFLNANSSFDFYLLYDSVSKKEIDASKAGKLKSVTYRDFNYLSLGIVYTFAM